MWTFIAIAAAAVSAVLIALAYAGARAERREFEATLSDDEREQLRGFLLVRRDWRDFATLTAAERGHYRYW